ncbi:Uncharacterised protein [Raoultella planticola]|uniref:Uncharacterized protein n=1 Tax=Raoultella planticola TaxID=575 RepID=A0A485D6I6_RAOPL|nr:Uncharacterised protein [Raoultella planticola]
MANNPRINRQSLMRELFWPIFIGALHREIIQILFGLAIWLSPVNCGETI